MKATAKLLATAVAVGGLGLAMEAEADRGRGGHGARGHGHHGHHHRHWGHGHRHWRGGWGLWLGAPLVFGAAYGWPYYFDYPRETIIYREREVFPEGTIEPAPEATTQVPRGEGAPSQGPLYMNYCESARAYFPKVTTCPEGWKLATPTN